MGRFFREVFPGVRGGTFAHALSLEKDHGLEQQVGLARFTLHVIGGVFVFYVRIEAEDRHGEGLLRLSGSGNVPPLRGSNLPASLPRPPVWANSFRAYGAGA